MLELCRSQKSLEGLANLHNLLSANSGLQGDGEALQPLGSSAAAIGIHAFRSGPAYHAHQIPRVPGPVQEVFQKLCSCISCQDIQACESSKSFIIGETLQPVWHEREI